MSLKKISILNPERPRQHRHLDELTEEVNRRKFVKFSMNIPTKIHLQFSIKTTVQGLDMKDVLMKAIYNYLEKEDILT